MCVCVCVCVCVCAYINTQVTLSTNNVSNVVEENKQINNLPPNNNIKKNERTNVQSTQCCCTDEQSAHLFKKLQSKCFKWKFQKNCLKDNYSSAVTS